mmetsp:Transcript_86304/g.234014  ORF Transcript_86304/g.234014 Transcript_86304/m.234014 type:complete len:126 (-) Transcript_86304:219-596(-)
MVSFTEFPEELLDIGRKSTGCSSGAPTPKSGRSGDVVETPSRCSNAGSDSGSVKLPAMVPKASLAAGAAASTARALATATGMAGRGGIFRAHVAVIVTAQFEGAEVTVELVEGELERGFPGSRRS